MVEFISLTGSGLFVSFAKQNIAESERWELPAGISENSTVQNISGELLERWQNLCRESVRHFNPGATAL